MVGNHHFHPLGSRQLPGCKLHPPNPQTAETHKNGWFGSMLRPEPFPQWIFQVPVKGGRDYITP